MPVAIVVVWEDMGDDPVGSVSDDAVQLAELGLELCFSGWSFLEQVEDEDRDISIVVGFGEREGGRENCVSLVWVI